MNTSVQSKKDKIELTSYKKDRNSKVKMSKMKP